MRPERCQDWGGEGDTHRKVLSQHLVMVPVLSQHFVKVSVCSVSPGHFVSNLSPHSHRAKMVSDDQQEPSAIYGTDRKKSMGILLEASVVLHPAGAALPAPPCPSNHS